ncbi:MAG: LacI family DNA-binding transcriptional regulator [Pseudomonadota bacterium]
MARLAGVSQMTVSRVMRDAGYISHDVRGQVVQAARNLGYVHNRLAGGQASYDNPLVGVVLPTLHNRVFTEVLSGISDTLAESGLRPVFGVTEYAQLAEEDLVFDLLSWRPRGLILAGLEHSDAVRRILAQTGVRVAEVMDTDGTPISACFGISQQAVGREMADHLLDRGYRRFGYVARRPGVDLRAEKRFAAFAERVQAAGAQIVATQVADGGSPMAAGRRVTGDLLHGAVASRPDAVYYANDDLAAGGLMHCLAEGLSVPSDIALAGFNGLGFLAALPLQITTTETPLYEIGATAAAWIRTDESGVAPAPCHQFQTRLIAGDTT